MQSKMNLNKKVRKRMKRLKIPMLNTTKRRIMTNQIHQINHIQDVTHVVQRHTVPDNAQFPEKRPFQLSKTILMLNPMKKKNLRRSHYIVDLLAKLSTCHL